MKISAAYVGMVLALAVLLTGIAPVAALSSESVGESGSVRSSEQGSAAQLLATQNLFGLRNTGITSENQKPGTREWKLARPSDDYSLQIKGFASATSVDLGDRLGFHVSVSSRQSYRIEIYRMGWYGGDGGRLVSKQGPFEGTTQPVVRVDSATGMVTAPWSQTSEFTVPQSWTSGTYLAKLIRADGFDNHVPFVVRDDSGAADILVQVPHATYQAYNNFPDNGSTGKSLYDHNSYGPEPANGPPGQKRATRVSFDRPYAGDGSGQFFSYDYPAIRWLERQGYDLSYSTSVDTHTSGAAITRHRAFISIGHDEYWSAEMYDAAESARDDSAGNTDLAFLGANDVYWRIFFGNNNREISSNRNFNNDRWRSQGRPEQELIGVQYVSPFGFNYKPLVVAAADSFVWQGTAMAEGSQIDGIVGYEIDNRDPTYPGPITRTETMLAASPFEGNTHQTSIYQAPSGSWVFASGTMNWSWGLGDPAGPQYESGAIQRATANVLDRFLESSSALVRDATSISGILVASDYDVDLDADVLRYYRAYFNREPDLAGAKYWLQLRRTGFDRHQIAEFMSGSTEFSNTYANASERDYLTRLYQNILGRTADQAGFDYWLDVLEGRNRTGLNAGSRRLSRAGVAFWVAQSAEFRRKYPYRP